MLSEQQLLAEGEHAYMGSEQLAFFAARLGQLKQQTHAHIDQVRRELAVPPELNDDADRARYEEEAAIALRMLDRERQLLPKIDAALKRIARGEYGYCLDTGEPIGIARLLIRPTAELCAEAKAFNEEKEKRYAHK